METQDQEALNALTAIQGEHPRTIHGCRIRRASIESIANLGMVGSPFAAQLNAAINGVKLEEKPPVTPIDILIYAWIHAEDPDTVLDTVMLCAPGAAEPAQAAALRFTRGWTSAEIRAVVEITLGEESALQAATFDMAAPSLISGSTQAKKKV